MTVSSVTEMWSRRNGVYEAKDTVAIKFQAVTAYQVVHEAGDSEDTILLDSAIPRVHDEFPGKPGVYATKVSREAAGVIMSIVTVEWEGDTGSESNTDPTTTPTKWVWSNTITSEPVDTDADGIPLCNSNGELKEGFTKEVSDFALSLTRNFQSVNTYALIQYLDSINSDAWGPPDSIWPAGTATLRSYVAEVQLPGGNQYYTVNAQVDFRVPYLTIPARAWWYRYRNDGMNVQGGSKVTFSGGGASAQATGFPLVTAGALTGVVVTYGGRGYTSAPTVTVSGGSGGSATASIANGRVVSVSASGGTGYAGRLVRAVDSNKEPEPRPVCLKLDGSREYDPNAAIWIERKKKQYALPYAALGFF
jgi:hypothetical protein